MKLISHRGNILGSNSANENKPEYIKLAISAGYDCEVDVWYTNNSFYLGHDKPIYKINTDFLINNKLWCHAKNLASLDKMIDMSVHCFWHENDNYTLTSNNYIWTYPGQKLTKRSIIVDKNMTGNYDYELDHVYGICSDYVGQVNKNNKNGKMI